MKNLPFVTAAATVTGATLAAAYYSRKSKSGKRVDERTKLRAQLPSDLRKWRLPGSLEDEEKIWTLLDPVLREQGLTPWEAAPRNRYLFAPDDSDFPRSLASGFAYMRNHRQLAQGIGRVTRTFAPMNGSTRVVRTRDGHDMMVRVITLKDQGQNHLSIIRKLATGENSFISENHALPMLSEFSFQDITFGLFPRVGASMEDAFDSWAKNSAGDVVDMLMQGLEALAFIHSLKIAHRDAFYDNFLVQWHPESLTTVTIAPSRPRVYIIDFEVAVEFPEELPFTDCVVTGRPLGGSFVQSKYSRPLAPEMSTDQPYSPFKLDVWQFGYYFMDVMFKTTLPEIDNIISSLTEDNWVSRPSAHDALKRMQDVVHSIPPSALLVASSVTSSWTDSVH